MALTRNTRIDGANTVALTFSTAVWHCDKAQMDRFVKCMRDLEATKDHGSFGLHCSPQG